MDTSTIKGVLIKGLPVLIAAAGGLVMAAGGYRGYEFTPNVLQWTGVIMAVCGASWVIAIVLVVLYKGIVSLFKPKL